MAETKVNLGMLPMNRGEYSSSAKYYKDNIVQYNGSSYVCTVPIGADIDNPAYSQGTAPYTSDPTQLNTGWATFASGNNTFTTGQNVNSIGVDAEPTAGSRNLVDSNGVESGDKYVRDEVLNMSSDILSLIDDLENITFDGELSNTAINSSGIIYSSLGPVLRYVAVNKGDRIRIYSSSQVNAVRYGFTDNIPALGDIVSGYVGYVSNETVLDICICGKDGYFCFYTTRPSFTVKKLNSLVSDYISSRLYNKIPFKSFAGGIVFTTGNINTGVSSRMCTDYVDVSNIQNIIYTRGITDGSGGGFGLAFYDSSKTFIANSGVQELVNQPKAGYVLHKVDVPNGASYARFTYWKNAVAGVFFFADGDRDSSAIALYNSINPMIEYNNTNDNYDGKFVLGGKELKIETHQHLNKISTYFDGNGTTIARGGYIFGLETGKKYNFHIKDTTVPVTGLNTGQGRFAIAVMVNGSSQDLYRVNDNTAPDSDIAVDIPKGAEYVYIWGRCNVGYKIECEITQVDIDVNRINILNGYEAGVYRATNDNGVDLGYVYNKDCALGDKVKVSKGDTILWSYGNVTIRRIRLCVYDENDNFIEGYNNTVANARTITNFMGSSQLSTFYIRASMKIANAKDSYIEVNGIRAWSAFSENVGNALNNKEALKYGYIKFEQGAINSSNGNLSDSNSRIRSNTIYCTGTLIFTVADDYVIRSVNYYTKSGVWYAGKIYKTSSVITEQQDRAGYVRVVVNKVTDTDTISPSDSIDFTINDYSGVVASDLQKRTFNSSYNEENTETIRLKYCGLVRGKGAIETFLFFTDPHLTMRNRAINTGWSNTNPTTEEYRDKYISMMQKYYNSLPVDACICGGDWINSADTYDQACEELGYQDAYMRKLFKNYYPVQGNHDNNPYNWGVSDYHALTQQDVNNLMFRQNGAEYYSFDGINTKFYVMNTGASSVYDMSDYRWEQVAWFANKLFADNPAHAIILTHIFSNGYPGGASGSYPNWTDGIHKMSKHLIDVADAFNNRQSIQKNGVTYDYSQSTGRVECYITGHTHADFVDTFHEIPTITCTDLQGGAYADRINYTDHSYAKIPTFDCCLADYNNHRLYMVRVGAGVSRTINLNKVELSVGETATLTPLDSGTVTWHAEHVIGDEGTFISVEDGVVTALAAGIAGVRAISENGDEEYWTIKVSQ